MSEGGKGSDEQGGEVQGMAEGRLSRLDPSWRDFSTSVSWKVADSVKTVKHDKRSTIRGVGKSHSDGKNHSSKLVGPRAR